MCIAKKLNAVAVLLVLGATGSLTGLLAGTHDVGADCRPQATVKAARTDDIPVHIVRPGKLSVTVVERGIVEACWNASAYCRVKGGAAISWIVPDGTIVLAGQPVCQLDSCDRLQTQIENGLIFASVGGVVLHANDPNRLGDEPVIEAGATVRERQQIFSIVDDTGPMRVNAKVPESVIDQIDRGLKARIRVDAFRGELLTGTVSEVAVLPDPVCFFKGFIKTYTARVQLNHGPAGVRPGMTAEVEILASGDGAGTRLPGSR